MLFWTGSRPIMNMEIMSRDFGFSDWLRAGYKQRLCIVKEIDIDQFLIVLLEMGRVDDNNSVKLFIFFTSK